MRRSLGSPKRVQHQKFILSAPVSTDLTRYAGFPVRVLGAIYGVDEAGEPFFCSYGLNPAYRPLLEAHGLVISGIDLLGEVRIVELPAHPFFVGTLFVPQARHSRANPHPLVSAFVAASRVRQGLGPQISVFDGSPCE